jgi:hypothetical protein
MRTRIGWLALLMTGIVLAPRSLQAQEVPALTDPTFPLPLYHDRPEKGGFYVAGPFLYWREVHHQRSPEELHAAAKRETGPIHFPQALTRRLPQSRTKAEQIPRIPAY